MINEEENTKISKIIDSFKFKKKSIFFIHTDLTHYNAKSNNWYEKCSNLYKFLNQKFKNDTILLPAFSWSFCKTKKFDIKSTPSEVGIFTEYFRNQKGVKRSNHPIFSIAAKGENSNLFTSNLSHSSTGEGSIFERLRTFDTYIIFFGSGFIQSCTFLHYIEQMAKIDYRYSKFFEGSVKDGNKIKYGVWEFYKNNEYLNLKVGKKSKN